jgi:hypothetical protein
VDVSRIHLTIDRLVLRGIDPGDRNALTKGLEAELARVLAEPAARREWARTHRTPVIRLGPMMLESGPAGGSKFGAGLARAIGGRLKP